MVHFHVTESESDENLVVFIIISLASFFTTTAAKGPQIYGFTQKSQKKSAQ